MEPEEQVLKIYEELKEIETEVTKQLGPQVWDYGPALLGTPSLSLDMVNLTPETMSLLKSYLARIQEILTALKLPQMPELENKPLQNFSEAMHTLYYLKEQQAEMLFADYELLRIQTWVETKIFEYSKGLMSEPDQTFAVNIPGSIVVTDDKMVDAEATLAKENNEHNIKSYLSGFPFAKKGRDSFLRDFMSFTTKGMVPRFYFKEMEELCEKLLTEVMIVTSKQVYSYLGKGYTPKQAQTNSYNYFLQILKDQNDKYEPDLAELGQKLRDITTEALGAIKPLEEQTKKIVTEELLAFMIEYFKTNKVFPWNYYKLEIRKANPKHLSELDYDYVIDSFLLENDGSVTSYPVETYAFAFTPEAKIDIFNYVTDGFINPNYSLEDYLAYI
jgi:hypothetical protein